MKKQFIETLKSYLSPLEEQERQEIMAFYEERFFTGAMYEGKTEQEIIDELENPKDIARNVLKEYGYRPQNKVSSEAQDDTVHFNFFKIFWILVFDLLIVTWLVPLLFSVVISVGSGLIGFLLNLNYPTTMDINAFLFIGFSLGVLFLWILLITWLYDVFVGFIIWLVRWHMDVFKIQGKKKVLRFLKQFQIHYHLKKHSTLYQWKQNLKMISAILIIIGGIALLLRQGQLEVFATKELASYQESIETEEGDLWTLEVSVFESNVNIIRTDEPNITVSGEVIEDYETMIVFDTETNTIKIENDRDARFVISGFWQLIFSEDSVLDVYIPRDIHLDSVDIIAHNGAVSINDFETLQSIDITSTNGAFSFTNITGIERLEARTTNGRITANHIQADTMILETTNGTITVETIVSDDLRLVTTNGNITMRQSDVIDAHISSSNGRINLTDINETTQHGQNLYAKTTNGDIELTNVYIKRVEIRTTNGNLGYHNTDRSFYLDRLIHQTTNGSKNIDVPKN